MSPNLQATRIGRSLPFFFFKAFQFNSSGVLFRSRRRRSSDRRWWRGSSSIGSVAIVVLPVLTELGDDPEAELLPVDGPLLQSLRLEARADRSLLDVAGPLLGRLVLEGRPADAVLGERAQAREPQVLPALEGLPEVVGAPRSVLAQHRRVVVAQAAGDAAGEQGRQRVAHDGAAEAEDFVADGAALDEDALLLDEVDEERVLVQTEAVADTPRAQKHGVVQVVVCLAPRTQTLARVEEEGDVDALLGALLAEPEEFREEVAQGPAAVLLSDQVVTRDEVRVCDLGRDALIHVVDDVARGEPADAAPDDAESPEPLAFGRVPELFDLLVQHVHHVHVVGVGCLAPLPVVVQPPSEAQLGVHDSVLLEQAHEPLQELPVNVLVVQERVDDAEALVELGPDLVDAMVLRHGVGPRERAAAVEPLEEAFAAPIGKGVGGLGDADEGAGRVVRTPEAVFGPLRLEVAEEQGGVLQRMG